MSFSLLQINNKVSFVTYGPVDGQTTFKGVVISIASGAAHPFKDDALANHTNIYPIMPEAVRSITEDDYRTYLYYAVLLENGMTAWIGQPWILESTITLDEDKTRQIIVSPGERTDSEIRLILEQNGIKVNSISDQN